MGTRGAFGLRKNGEDKLSYNHFDSYPDYLGRSLMHEIKDVSVESLNKVFDNIVMVQSDGKATPEQIEECKQWGDTGVSTGDLEDWYCLLRNAQGSLNPFLDGLKYMLDSGDVMASDSWCEWGYIVNLDTNMFEVY